MAIAARGNCAIVETQRLRSVQHPRRVGRLLDSLLDSDRFIPERANRITSAAELPAPLRRLSRLIDGADSVWRSWSDGRRIWFFEAVFSLELSRERGKPVIQLREYDEVGDLSRSRLFVQTAEHGWQACE